MVHGLWLSHTVCIQGTSIIPLHRPTSFCRRSIKVFSDPQPCFFDSACTTSCKPCVCSWRGWSSPNTLSVYMCDLVENSPTHPFPGCSYSSLKWPSTNTGLLQGDWHLPWTYRSSLTYRSRHELQWLSETASHHSYCYYVSDTIHRRKNRVLTPTLTINRQPRQPGLGYSYSTAQYCTNNSDQENPDRSVTKLLYSININRNSKSQTTVPEMSYDVHVTFCQSLYCIYWYIFMIAAISDFI